MKQQNNKLWQYVKQYQVSNITAMIRNNQRDPDICDASSEGKLVVITGATSGIGYWVAKKYASKGANLICINRSKEKSAALKRELEEEYGISCEYFLADLSSMHQTHAVADRLLQLEQPIDVLIHNAGVFLTKRAVTSDGLEELFMVHYLSSFIINYKLRKKLASQDSARVIMVNSEGHRFAPWGLSLDDLNWERRRYSGYKSYGSAKLAQLLSVLKFSDEFKDTGVVINAMHPGAVQSETGKDNGRFYRWYKRNVLDKMLRPAAISAESLYYLGISKSIGAITGKFFNLTTLEEPTPPALDKEVAEQLWDLSIEMGRLNEHANA